MRRSSSRATWQQRVRSSCNAVCSSHHVAELAFDGRASGVVGLPPGGVGLLLAGRGAEMLVGVGGDRTPGWRGGAGTAQRARRAAGEPGCACAVLAGRPERGCLGGRASHRARVKVDLEGVAGVAAVGVGRRLDPAHDRCAGIAEGLQDRAGAVGAVAVDLKRRLCLTVGRSVLQRRRVVGLVEFAVQKIQCRRRITVPPAERPSPRSPPAGAPRSSGPRPRPPDRLTSSFVPHPPMPPQNGTVMPEHSGAQHVEAGQEDRVHRRRAPRPRTPRNHSRLHALQRGRPHKSPRSPPRRRVGALRAAQRGSYYTFSAYLGRTRARRGSCEAAPAACTSRLRQRPRRRAPSSASSLSPSQTPGLGPNESLDYWPRPARLPMASGPGYASVSVIA
jgi:hypothetical protein